MGVCVRERGGGRVSRTSRMTLLAPSTPNTHNHIYTHTHTHTHRKLTHTPARREGAEDRHHTVTFILQVPPIFAKCICVCVCVHGARGVRQ